MSIDVGYRNMREGEEAKVCSLIEQVFNECVAPDYDAEGIHEFYKFANPTALAERVGSEQVVIVAEQGADLVGVIEMRNGDHIAMLFVSLRNKGVAKELFKKAVEECLKRKPELKSMSVNSSPYAEPIYCKMGFRRTGPFQKKKGITFVPMTRDLER